jgi:hypothetical protein
MRRRATPISSTGACRSMHRSCSPILWCRGTSVMIYSSSRQRAAYTERCVVGNARKCIGEARWLVGEWQLQLISSQWPARAHIMFLTGVSPPTSDAADDSRSPLITTDYH